MRNLWYQLIKNWIKIGLFFYFAKIKIKGRENIPKEGPLLLLGNHQNALLDALLIAVTCGIKPYFLTRGDVFKNPIAKMLLEYLHMIPVYRIRNGKKAVGLNHAIFDQCAGLLLEENSILLFPEGNHSLVRRVRPLSKGFTRMLFKALAENPKLNIKILPVGVNYVKAENFPDSAAIYFGDSFNVQEYYDEENLPKTIIRLKAKVFGMLSKLTTHIESETDYENIEKKLVANGVNYLNPTEVNNLLKSNLEDKKPNNTSSVFSKILKFLFVLLNFPVVFIWRTLIKPKIIQLEFKSTFRFMYSLLFYPICYVVFFFILGWVFENSIAAMLLCAHILFNFLYIKMSPYLR